jgi:hypothetical protein
MPDEREVLGLLAMMLLHDARREARFRGGDLVLLAEQERSLWDTAVRWHWSTTTPSDAYSSGGSLSSARPKPLPDSRTARKPGSGT